MTNDHSLAVFPIISFYAATLHEDPARGNGLPHDEAVAYNKARTVGMSSEASLLAAKGSIPIDRKPVNSGKVRRRVEDCLWRGTVRP